MYQIKRIGEVEFQNGNVKVVVDAPYRKGLRHAEQFSHIHLVYGCSVFDEERKASEIWGRMKSVVVRVQQIRMSEGVIIGHYAANLNESNVEPDCSGSILIDIKPYFPCEDRVRQENCIDKMEKSIPLHITRLLRTEERIEIESCGWIRKEEGRTFFEGSKEQLNGISENEIIRVYWWFHRFDKPIYRKVTECDPPYENAPKVGIFASRSPVRPNPIAMTLARVLKVDTAAGRVYVNDLDCFDRTPCISIVPYAPEQDYIKEVEVAEWVRHWPEYWVEEATEETMPVIEESQDCSDNGSYGDWEDSGEKVVNLNQWDDKNTQYESETFIKNARENLISRLTEQTLPGKSGLEVIGAYENNLKGIDVTIPYHKLTALVGVSGSGKSSLAYDTIYAECQRRFADIQGVRDVLPKPRMTRMSGVIPAIAVSQQSIGKNSRSTVGTYSDVYDELQSLFATIGVRHCPKCGKAITPMTIDEMEHLLGKEKKVDIYTLTKEPVTGNTRRECLKSALNAGNGACYATVGKELRLLQTKQMCYHCKQMMFELTPATFHYNDPESSCKRCYGRGSIIEISEDTIIQNKSKSLYENASVWFQGLREFKAHPNANWMKGEVFGLAEKYQVDLEQPYEMLPEQFRHELMNGTGDETVTFSYKNEKNGRNGSICRPAEGAIHAIKRFYSEWGNEFSFQSLVTKKVCPVCEGERLRNEGRLVTVGDLRYPVVARMTFSGIFEWCLHLCEKISEAEYEKVENTILTIARVSQMAIKLGIGYLELDRETQTLSGGEKKRLKLLTTLASDISGILYIMDEPTSGLHPKDYARLSEVFQTILSRGNTILMVEHNADLIKKADHIIEIGPGAGIHGGRVVENGPVVSCLNQLTKRILPVKEKLDDENGIQLEHINYRNLKDLSVQIPRNAITCIHGVSGSGKSTLLEEAIYRKVSENPELFQQVCYIDQQSIGRNQRSTPATYLKIMDELRKIYARTEEAKKCHFSEAAFSYNNAAGQCDCCKGVGKINPEFLPDVWVTCPQCKGRRYKENILEIRYKGYSISDVLELSVEQAAEVFAEEKKLEPVLKLMSEVSLGYLMLGQSTTTLSGGEAQRIKLVNELTASSKGNTLYLFDEPTSGLSSMEVKQLLKLFHRLIHEGNTIIVIEHNPEILENADYQIELGPGAGEEGGRIVSQGPIGEMLC